MMIRKTVLIINGKPRAGKDTFVELLSYMVPVYKYSIIEKVKSIALDCGWKGGKEEEDRKFLCDLKKLTDDYSDLSFTDVYEKITQFAADEIKEPLFAVDIREPEDIEMMKDLTGAITVFIENENVPEITSNPADANVYNYDYDFVVKNNGTMDDYKKEVYNFILALLPRIELKEEDDE